MGGKISKVALFNENSLKMHFVSNLNCSFEIGEKFWTFFYIRETLKLHFRGKNRFGPLLYFERRNSRSQRRSDQRAKQKFCPFVLLSKKIQSNYSHLNFSVQF
jgi:hypothetical protein